MTDLDDPARHEGLCDIYIGHVQRHTECMYYIKVSWHHRLFHVDLQ